MLGAIAGAIGNLVGGGLQMFGQDQANRQQQQGYSNANGILNDRFGRADTQIMEGYNNARDRLSQVYPVATGNLQGYSNLAGASNNQLSDLIGSGYGSRQFNNQDLQSNLAPNYQFQLAQGQGSTNALGNLGGGLIGGNAFKGMQDYTQNFAGTAYQNAFNNFNTQRNNIFGNLTGVSQMAAAPTTALSNLQSGYGSSQAGLDINQAQNQANLNVALGGSLADNNINAGNAAANSTNAIYGTAGGMARSAGNFFQTPKA